MGRMSFGRSRLLRYVLYAFAVLIVVFAVALNLARILLPNMKHSRQYLEHWASSALSRPVSFDSLTARWRGTEPVFQFNGVKIHSPDKKASQLAIQQLDISISWWQSLLNMRLVPGHVEIIGTKFHIKQLSTTKYLINNSPIDLSVTGAKTNASDFSWLFHTGLYLSDSDVYLRDMHGNSLHLSPVELAVKSEANKDLIAGLLTFKQTIPTTVRFSLHIDTKDLAENKLHISAYVAGEKVSLLQWQNFLQNWFSLPEKVRGGKADIQFWADIGDNKIQKVSSKINLHYFGIQGWHLKQRVFFPNVKINCSWAPLKDGWLFNVSKLHAHLPGVDWPDNTFSWRQDNSSGGQRTSTINVGFLRLQDLPVIEKQLDAVPASFNTWYKRFAPHGDVHDLRLTWQRGLGIRALQASLTGASWRAWNKIPGMKNINLHVKTNRQYGNILLDSTGGDFTSPLLFADSIHYNYLHIPLKWIVHKSRWQLITDYKAQLLGVSMRGRLHVLTLKHKSPRIDFLAGYSVADISKIKRLLPKKTMGKALYSWLSKAFVTGDILSGTMLLRGPLDGFPYLDHSGHFEVLNNIRDLNFHYYKRWPDMHNTNAKLVFDNRSMYADFLAGNLRGMQVKSGHAVIKNLQYAHLYIDSKLGGDLAGAVNFMRNTPLHVAKTFKSLNLTGPYDLDLHLDLPIKSHGPQHTSGVVTIHNAKLFLKKWNLSLDNLNGPLRFHGDFLSSKKLSATIFNKSAIVSMNTKKLKVGQYLAVNINGAYSGAAFRHYLNIKSSKYWTGDADYDARLRIPSGDRASTLKVKIAGLGNKFSFPGYFYKSATDPTNIYVSLLMSLDNKLQLRVAYGRRWNIASRLLLSGISTQLSGLYLQIGPKLALMPSSAGVSLAGYLPVFDYEEWNSWLRSNGLLDASYSPAHKHSAFNINKINLSISAVKYNKHVFHKVALVINPEKDSWRVALNAPVAAGVVFVPNNLKSGILHGTLNHLNLDKYSKSTKEFKLDELPNLSLSINSLAWNGTQYGAVAIESRSKPNHFYLLRLVAKTDYLSFTGSGSWSKSRGKQISYMRGNIKSNNFGALLDKYKLSDLLADGKGFISFDLHWFNSFRKVVDSDLSGSMNVNISDGRITKISKSAESEMGIGRVLSLLSLQTLPRRLSLNFDDLFKSGYSFDSWTGNWSLKNGLAATNDSIVDGPVAKVLMQGELNFPNKRYDLFLRVQPHLTGSLPVIATVIGTPIAGAITWAFNKILINPLVGRVMQSSFSIKGAWDKPKVKQLAVSKRRGGRAGVIPAPGSAQ